LVAAEIAAAATAGEIAASKAEAEFAAAVLVPGKTQRGPQWSCAGWGRSSDGKAPEAVAESAVRCNRMCGGRAWFEVQAINAGVPGAPACTLGCR
jgi:hypothetical protein